MANQELSDTFYKIRRSRATTQTQHIRGWSQWPTSLWQFVSAALRKHTPRITFQHLLHTVAEQALYAAYLGPIGVPFFLLLVLLMIRPRILRGQSTRAVQATSVLHGEYNKVQGRSAHVFTRAGRTIA
jgi:hypothetical protein|eukprot:1535828-Prymnesium_polylepis.1